jgi:uncharacterized protein YjbI with pentapeptide repeats
MLGRWLQSRRKPKVDLSCVDPNFLHKTHRMADWSGRHFDNFVPVGCVFESCSFESCRFVQVCFGGGLEDSRYVNCSFDRSLIRATSPGNARFQSCSFLNVEIVEFLGHSIEMIDCSFSGVIRVAFFNGDVLADTAAELGRARNVFEGNDFSKARLDDVSFRTGIDLSRQKLPNGWRNEA